MIQNHVTNLELSKKLYEAGIVVENPLISWKWSDLVPGEVLVINGGAVPISGKIHSIPAPLASELGQLLPRILYGGVDNPGGVEWLVASGIHDKGQWSCGYIVDGMWTIRFSDNTESNARAKMILFLKEKGLLGGTK